MSILFFLKTECFFFFNGDEKSSSSYKMNNLTLIFFKKDLINIIGSLMRLH